MPLDGYIDYLYNVLNMARSEAVELEVTTCIDSSDLDQLEQPEIKNYFYTHINLLQRTINHEIDCKLIDNPAYGELQRWHIKQVQQRQNTLIKNLVNLQNMLTFIKR